MEKEQIKLKEAVELLHEFDARVKLAERYEMLRTKYISAEGRAAYYKQLYEDTNARLKELTASKL